MSHLLECTHPTALGWKIGWEMWSLFQAPMCPAGSPGFTKDEEEKEMGPNQQCLPQVALTVADF